MITRIPLQMESPNTFQNIHADIKGRKSIDLICTDTVQATVSSRLKQHLEVKASIEVAFLCNIMNKN